MAYKNTRDYIWYKRIRKYKKNKRNMGDKTTPKETSAGGPSWSQETPTGPFHIP
jgi:hypothetical protein